MKAGFVVFLLRDTELTFAMVYISDTYNMSICPSRFCPPIPQIIIDLYRYKLYTIAFASPDNVVK